MDEEYKEVLQDLSISVAEKISKEWLFLTHEEKRLADIVHDALIEASRALVYYIQVDADTHL